MLCCWIEEPNSEAFKLHLPRVSDYLWVAEDGMKMQVWKINKIIYSIFLHFLASFFNLSPTYLNNSCPQLYESNFQISWFCFFRATMAASCGTQLSLFRLLSQLIYLRNLVLLLRRHMNLLKTHRFSIF